MVLLSKVRNDLGMGEKRINVISRYENTTLHLTPVGVLYFGSAPRLGEILIDELAAHQDAEKLLIDLRKVGRIDYTGALTLQQIAQDAESSNLQVSIVPGDHLQGVRLLKRVFGADSHWLSQEPEKN